MEYVEDGATTAPTSNADTGAGHRGSHTRPPARRPGPAHVIPAAPARHPKNPKGTPAPVSERPSTTGGGHNTRHPTGIRIVLAVLAALTLILGPAGYLMGLQADSQAGSAAEWFTLAFGAAIGLPFLGAAVATVAGDRRAALWCLALLAWPVVFVSAIHLSFLGG